MKDGMRIWEFGRETRPELATCAGAALFQAVAEARGL